MKKIVSLFLAIAFMLTAFAVNAQTPAFLTDVYSNYTAGYDISFSFENSNDIAALLEEVEMPEEISNYIDLNTLLKTLLSFESKMTIQADMNKDFNKIKLSMVSDSQHDIDVNKNLNVALTSKTGMWMNIDLTAKEPVFEVIYSYPYFNKYMHINLFDMIDDEGEKLELISALSVIFNKDFLSDIQQISASLLTKHANIKQSGLKWIVKLDNDALIAMINELIPILMDKISNLAQVFDADPDIDYMSAEYSEIPSFDGLQLLGDEGITYTYNLTSGKISSAKISADICLDISNLYELISGEAWEYDTNGILAFKYNSDAKITDIDKTKVTFPTLTEKNSFTPEDMYPKYSEPEPALESESEYPHFYASQLCDNLPVIDNKIYVPLRATIESAYEDMAQITFENGAITLTSDYFTGFDKLKLTVGSTIAYTDETAHEIDKVIMENGTTYVSVQAFETLLGWQFGYANYDLIEKVYDYAFYTRDY